MRENHTAKATNSIDLPKAIRRGKIKLDGALKWLELEAAGLTRRSRNIQRVASNNVLLDI